MIVNDNTEQKYGIKAIVLEQLIGLAKTYHLKQLILFGSRARGDYHRTSDIDLAISGGNFARFSIDAEELTETLLKYDFINLDSAIQKELLLSIEQEGIVLYEEI